MLSKRALAQTDVAKLRLALAEAQRATQVRCGSDANACSLCVGMRARRGGREVVWWCFRRDFLPLWIHPHIDSSVTVLVA